MASITKCRSMISRNSSCPANKAAHYEIPAPTKCRGLFFAKFWSRYKVIADKILPKELLHVCDPAQRLS